MKEKEIGSVKGEAAMEKEKKFECEQCDLVFEAYEEYLEHMRIYHWDEEDEADQYSEQGGQANRF